MSKPESIDHQIGRLLDAFDGAREESLKLAVVENGLALLEARLWLADLKEAAVFCVELERLRAHQVAEPSADAFNLFASNLRRLQELGQQQFNSELLAAVNEMRAVRGALRFERATSLAQAERVLWREMHRRVNVPRRLRRHMNTVIDLLRASEDSVKSARALPMLGREAEALKTLFRFNPSNLVWGSLHSLCTLAHRAQSPVSLPRLKEYCESLDAPSETAKSLFAALPCLEEIAAQIEQLEGEHPLQDLLDAPTEEIAPGDATVEEASFSESLDLPVEVKNLSEALENLSGQVAAGLLEETALTKDIQSLAERVLGKAGEEGKGVSTYAQVLEHLCELIDLAASGVKLPESEFESLAADLEEYVSGPKALRQIDDALMALNALRDHIARHPDKRPETDMEEQEFEDLLARMARIQGMESEGEEDSATRFLGYLIVRGGLNYAFRHREDMRVEPVRAALKNDAQDECDERLIDDLFPQSEALAAPKQRLTLSESGRRIGIACDEVRGPFPIDLLRAPKGDYGFARLADGVSLCLLSPELLLSHYQ